MSLIEMMIMHSTQGEPNRTAYNRRITNVMRSIAMATRKQKSISEIRNAAELNQKDFWSRYGVTQSGGSRYESGRSIPMPLRILVQLL
jgi:DNA-binding transcriptional regulator YiaG